MSMALQSESNYNSDSCDSSEHSDLGLSEGEEDVNVSVEAIKKDEAIKVDRDWKCRKHSNRCNKLWHSDMDIPFASGKFRFAFLGHYCKGGVEKGKTYGQVCVVKKWKTKHVMDKSFWDRDIRVTDIAIKFADKWNIKMKQKYQLKRSIRVLKPIIGTWVAMDAKYKDESLLQPHEAMYQEKVLVEDYLPGKFTKWNSNSGHFNHPSSAIQAFCHWTYHYSDGKILFCDAQGVKTNHEYILTDPLLLSNKGGHYGSGDCGREYMVNWFIRHECNQYCDKNWKKAIGNIIHETIIPTEASTFVWELTSYAKQMESAGSVKMPEENKELKSLSNPSII